MESTDLTAAQPPLLEDPLLEAVKHDPMTEALRPGAALETHPHIDASAPDPDDRAALKRSLFVASRRPKPPTWAGVLKASRDTGLSPDLVARNPDRVQQLADQRAQPDLDRIVTNNPALAQWLSNPDNLALSRHELEPLGRLDRATGAIARVASDAGTATATGAADLASAAGQLAAAYGMASPATAARFVADMQQRAQSLRDQAPGYVKDSRAAVSEASAGVDRAFSMLTAAAPSGLVTAGNIDVTKRPRVVNPDGSVSTVRSMSVEQDGHEVLIPTISDDGRVLSDDDAVALYEKTGKHLGVFKDAASANAYAEQLHNAQSAMIAGLGTGAVEPSRTQRVLNAISRFASPMPGIPTPEVALMLGETLDLVRAHGARGLAYTGLESLASMAPMLAGSAAGAATGAAIGTVVPVVGTAAGGVIGGMTGTFAGMAPVNVGNEITAELVKRGVDVTNADALERAFSDPAFMAGVRSKAERAGVTSALVASLASGFAGKLGEMAKGSNLATRTAAHAADVSIQAGALGAGQAAGQAAKGERVSVGQAIETAISTLGVSAGMEAIGASRRAALHPETHEAAIEATAKADDALRAHHDAALLEEIGHAVEDAPTTALVPERLRDLIETAAGGADASTVYFQSDDFNRYWTGRGESPAAKAAEIMQDGGKGYAEAQTTDAPLAIPLADYVSRVAPTEHFQGLLPHARMRPEGASLEEARAYLDDLPATMRELATEAGVTSAASTRGEDVGSSAVQVGEHVRAQLERSGIGEAAARAQAALYESTFRSLAQRAGVDPAELFSRYGLKITRGRARQAIDKAAETSKSVAATMATEGELAAEDVATAGELARPRDNAGRIRTDLSTATLDELSNEYATLVDANAQENVAGHLARDENFHTMNDGRSFLVTGQAGIHARGRVASRAKSIARVQAELTRRGVDTGDAYMRGYQNIQNLDPEAFTFSQAATGGDPRGRIEFGEHGVSIELLAKADRSTFLHETGHFYHNVLHDLANAPNASEQIRADYATARAWLGAEGDAPLTRAQHEQWARGFEAYLMEGKAPSAELRGAFYRFRQWLVGIYKDLRALTVELSPDVRGVFDRLVATDAEIARAEAETRPKPLFDDPKDVGLSTEQFAKYQRDVAEAHQAATEQLTARMMNQIRREESAQWKEWREPIEADVTKDVDSRPEIRALEFLRKGTNPDGSPLPEGMTTFKLDRRDVEALLGKDGARDLPRGVYGENGLAPDPAAELFGFETGRELLEALRNNPSRDGAIRAETARRMQEEHGERMSDADVHTAALEAVNGEKRAQVLRTELEILASNNLATVKGLVRAVTRVVPSTEAVRAQAATIIGAKSVQELKPRTYELAARRAATEARESLLRGDVEKAFDAKRRELLNTELLRAATKERDVIEGALDEFKKMFRRDERLAESRDIDLVNAARSILASFGIGRTDKPASAYLEQLAKYDPETYDTVTAMVNDATANARDYKELSIDDFHTLRDTVAGIWQMSRRAREVEIDGRRIDRQQVVGELANRLEAFTPAGPRPGESAAVTRGEKRLSGFASMWAALRRVEHWVRQIDAGADDGPFRRYVWNPVNEGAIAFRVEKNRRMGQYRAIVDQLEPTMSHEKIPAPELGYTFDGKRELLGALLHTGNESNLRKLLAGRHWGAIDEGGVLDSSRWRAFIARMHAEGTLVKADYDFTQAVWNLFEETKAGAQVAHHDMYGRYFEEITAQPFATPFGKYEGGYYPAKADPFLVPEQGRRESATSVIQSDNSSLFPSTGRGFTKSRVEYNRPLIIDANSIPTHLDAVLRFTHINPRVVDVARILRDRTFAGAMDQADAHAISELLDPWLRRSAQQAIDTPARSKAGRAVDDMARRLRRNAGMQILSASLMTAAEQLTHVPAVALRVKPSSLARGLWEFTRAPKQTAAEIHGKSDYMATRESAGLMEVRRAIEHIMLDPTVAQRAGAWMNEHAMFLTRAIQHVEDHVTWGGAYDEAVRGGMDETAAVRHADAVVREVLGAFEPESISRFEASAPVVKLFSMFYSFFNTKANFLKTDVTNVVREDIGLGPKAAKLAAVYTFGFLLPAVMATGIKHALSGQPFDKDDDGSWDDVFRLFFGSQLEQGGRMIPVAGPLAEFSIEHVIGGKPADLVSSPALGLLQQAAQVPGDVLKVATQGEITRGEITDLFTLIGLVTGTPARPLAKPLGYLTDVQKGRVQPTGPLDFARGIVTGR